MVWIYGFAVCWHLSPPVECPNTVGSWIHGPERLADGLTCWQAANAHVARVRRLFPTVSVGEPFCSGGEVTEEGFRALDARSLEDLRAFAQELNMEPM